MSDLEVTTLEDHPRSKVSMPPRRDGDVITTAEQSPTLIGETKRPHSTNTTGDPVDCSMPSNLVSQPVVVDELVGDANRRIVIEADEIVFRVGNATLSLRNDGDGVIELKAPTIRILGDEVSSEATETHTTKGMLVISEAGTFSDLLGKLIRINGQCVKINC